MNTPTTWHMVSTRPSEEIFSRMILFLEKDRKVKKMVSIKNTEQTYSA